MSTFKTKPKANLLIILSIMILGLSACGQQDAAEQGQIRLPISINEVMASLINHSADPIWVAAWRSPQSEADWRESEHLARQLQVGGALLSIPGTGPADEQWVSNSDWRKYAGQLSTAAGDAVIAANTKNVAAIAAAGDEIVAICESCHTEFKPDTPTMNIYGELSPTAENFN
jgi:cytochrome c556